MYSAYGKKPRPKLDVGLRFQYLAAYDRPVTDGQVLLPPFQYPVPGLMCSHTRLLHQRLAVCQPLMN